MKKIFTILIALITLSVTANISNAYEITGEAVNTDIRAYINSIPIKSYNIDGWTGVIAEDLRDYGFSVEWNGEKRELNVYTESELNEVTANYSFPENKKPIGSHAENIYKTDIKTFVNSKEVKSFNIGGQTIIYIDELQAFGKVIWDSNERTISYTYQKPWSISLMPDIEKIHHPYGVPLTNTFKNISLEAKKQDGVFLTDGENLGHLSWINISHNKREGGLMLGFSMVAEHLLADTEFSDLCNKMVTNRCDGLPPVQENANVANEHTKILINGEPITIKAVNLGKGNNHTDYYFVLDCDIEKDNIKTISFECGV